MAILQSAARFVLGGILLVFAADYVFHFLPELPFTEAGGRYLEALLATGYMFPLIKTVEVIGALLILEGRLAPLGALLIAPVVFNIALYHLILDPNGITVASVLAGTEAFLLWRYRAAYRGIVAPQQTVAPTIIDVRAAPHAASIRP